MRGLRLFLLILPFLVPGPSLSAQSEGPLVYTCLKASSPIEVDGLASERAWSKVPWSSNFVDIEGSKKPLPYHQTRVKMLWDSNYFYVFAEMEEPHVWAKLTQRDAIIFRDNDFEVFIDPDGDTHNYYELEINALNTVWDLLLTRPYRDGGHAIDHWDINGLKTAVNVQGTLNDPSDEDTGWSVEIAMPWDALKEATRMKGPPIPGDQWRINFSRVQWETEIVDGDYVKKKDSQTGKNLRENNWVWSPMRAIAMHEPEFWGLVEFQEEGKDRTAGYSKKTEEIRRALYTLHRAQRSYYRQEKVYAHKLIRLELEPFTYSNGEPMEFRLFGGIPTQDQYIAMVYVGGVSGIAWLIDQTGRIWSQQFDDE